jgi:antitoxin (DNA-binding transcriptional repressor) of toxin-antitoxin stability system
MTTIEMKDLMPKLHECLVRARAGEHIIVTDCGEPVADLTPHNSTRRTVLDAVERGELRWNGGTPKGLRGVVVRGEPISDTVVRARR